MNPITQTYRFPEYQDFETSKNFFKEHGPDLFWIDRKLEILQSPKCQGIGSYEHFGKGFLDVIDSNLGKQVPLDELRTQLEERVQVYDIWDLKQAQPLLEQHTQTALLVKISIAALLATRELVQRGKQWTQSDADAKRLHHQYEEKCLAFRAEAKETLSKHGRNQNQVDDWSLPRDFIQLQR